MTRYGIHWLAVLALLLGGCGGGGGGGGGGSSSSASGSGGDPLPAAAANVQTVTVEPGPADIVNTLYTTVTVCVPNTATCQTVNHVLVDTGSVGLRLMASVLQLTLPQSDSANAIAECTHFADGYTWGPLKSADIKIAGEEAPNATIQVIGDPAFADVPNDCNNSGPSENTVKSFGANGVLGVGLFKQDCGTACALDGGNGIYYLCPCGQASTSSALSLDRQVPNPVALFANDNNGVIIQLPAAPAEGSPKLTGAMLFGIGTQANNGLNSAEVFKTADTGTVVTTYNSKLYNDSLIDSGSSLNFFTDSTIPTCPADDLYAPGFYCPAATRSLTAVITGLNGAPATLAFSVANAHNLFSAHPENWAFSNVATTEVLPNSFIWGLPTFMGRSVYTAIEGENSPGGVGPYFALTALAP